MSYIQLGDICDVVKGEIGITKAIPGDYPMVTTGEHRKSHNKFQLDTAAVLIPLVSATGHGHASINRIHYQEGKFAFGSILAACVPKNKKYSAKFLHIYFNLMKDYVLVPLMKGSANVSLTLGNLKTAKVPDISLESQLIIVELYYKIKIELDKAKDLLNSQKNDIAKLRQSILQEAVQGKLTADWRLHRSLSGAEVEDASVLLKRIQKEKAQLIKDKKIKKEKPLPAISKDEVPYELPEGWVWCRIGDILNVKSSKRVFQSDYVSEGVPFFRSKEIGQLGRGQEVTTELFITRGKFENFKDNFGVTKPGDVLMACIGGSIGNTWLVDDREFYYKDGNLVQLDSIPQIDSFYLLKYLDSNVFYDSALGKVSGSAYNALTIEKIKNSLFPLPNEEEQKAIVQKVNVLMGLCDALEQEVQQSQEQSEQLMQSCLREVFN